MKSVRLAIAAAVLLGTGAQVLSAQEGEGPSGLGLGRSPASSADDLGGGAEQDWNYDPSEPRYCVCNQVSYGDMVACDNDDVRILWFTLSF